MALGERQIPLDYVLGHKFVQRLDNKKVLYTEETQGYENIYI